MALPKPSKGFYKLEEVAEEWGWSINDIFDYAEQELLQLKVIIREKARAFPVPYVKGSEAPPSLEKFVEQPHEDYWLEISERNNDPYFKYYELEDYFPYYISGIYPIQASSINTLRLPYKVGFELTVPDSKEEFPIVKFWKVYWDPQASGNYNVNLQMLIITNEEKTRLEGCSDQGLSTKKTEHIKSEISNHGGDQEDSGNQILHGQGATFPGSIDEGPKNGIKEIAEYVGKTPDYLKRCWKKDGYPINKDKKGRLYAYPSNLNGWRSSK